MDLRHGSTYSRALCRVHTCTSIRLPLGRNFILTPAIVASPTCAWAEITEIPQPMSPGYIINIWCGRMQYIALRVCSLCACTWPRSRRDEGWKVDCYSSDGVRGRQSRPEKLVYCCRIIAPHINVRISFECCFISLICATLRPSDIPSLRPPHAGAFTSQRCRALASYVYVRTFRLINVQRVKSIRKRGGMIAWLCVFALDESIYDGDIKCTYEPWTMTMGEEDLEWCRRNHNNNQQ